MAGMPSTRNGSDVTWAGDMPAPVATYARAMDRTPLVSSVVVPASTNKTNSAVVNRKPLRRGLRYFYSHGGIEMPMGLPIPGAASGNVFISAYQRILVQLHDWSQNDAWYICYPRNLGYSFRADQLRTKINGPAGSRMAARPLFPKVQTVKRYNTTPPAYPTRSARS